MNTYHASELPMIDLIDRIQSLDAAGIDPEFDREYQDLTWEFAARYDEFRREAGRDA